MNPYARLVLEYQRLQQEGRAYPLPTSPGPLRSPPRSGAPVALIFAPHPDDEAIIGGLPLRLRREAAWKVVAVAVTQGSHPARQAERWKEFEACCDSLAFEPLQAVPGGLTRVNAPSRAHDPIHWARGVQVIADILEQQRPSAIFFPHDADWNSTHIGTHYLVLDALQTLGPEFQTRTLETEFWAAMKTPNLMVEIAGQELADLMAALAFHAGEVQRNPYHLTLPAWMIDNVRRGAELVLGQGGAAPAFTFATLYRLQKWQAGGFAPVLGAPRALSSDDDVAALIAG